VYRKDDVRRMFVSKVGASRCILMDGGLSSVDWFAIALCVLHNSDLGLLDPA